MPTMLTVECYNSLRNAQSNRPGVYETWSVRTSMRPDAVNDLLETVDFFSKEAYIKIIKIKLVEFSNE